MDLHETGPTHAVRPAPGLPPAAAPDPGSVGGRPDRRQRGLRGAHHRRGPHRLRYQHRLRPAGVHPHRARGPGSAAKLAGAVARGRRGRAAGRRHGAPDHGAEDQQPGARLLRHPPQGHRRADRAGQRRGLSAHPAQGLGGRVGRPGAAGAHVPAVAGREPRAPSRRVAACPPGAGNRRPAAVHAGGQGRPGAVERHPGVDRLCPARPVRGRGPDVRGAGLRRPERGSHAGLARPSIRASTRRAANAARSTWPPSTAIC